MQIFNYAVAAIVLFVGTMFIVLPPTATLDAICRYLVCP